MQERYFTEEDLRRFLECPRKAWYRRRGYKSKLDHDPFLAFLTEESGRVREASVRLFRRLEPVGGNGDAAVEFARRRLLADDDVSLARPCVLSGAFLSRPTVLLRRGGVFYVFRASAKSGDENAHASGRMLITYFGNLRAEWKELVHALAFDCAVLRRLYPGVAIKPYLILPSIDRVVGEVEASLATNGGDSVGSVTSDEEVAERRKRSVLRFFEASAAVELVRSDVSSCMDRLMEMVRLEREPDPALKYACRNCEFRSGKADEHDGFAQCWGELAQPQPHLFDLHQLYSLKCNRGLLADAKISHGETGLFTISEGELHGEYRERQALQIRTARSKEEWIDPWLKDALDALEWPVRFVDFETSMSALPWLVGVKPYELLPFQWSLHALERDGELRHAEWLHDGKGVPMRDFVVTLKNALGEEGHIFIYTDYEIRVLNEAAAYLTREYGERCDEVQWIRRLLTSGRIVDQHDWVYRYYCHPLMSGRTSLKVALPAAWNATQGLWGDFRFSEYLRRDLDGSLVEPYSTLPAETVKGKAFEVREGCGAMKAYREMAIGIGRSCPEARAQLRTLLLAYCKLDTAAQVILFERWRAGLGLTQPLGTQKRAASLQKQKKSVTMKKYKNKRSEQQARQIARNREANLPRLNQLKELMGCYACGRCDVPGPFLDGHHVNQNSKFKPLAWLINRNWRRVITEILGVNRGQNNGGGPVVFVCQRFHEDQHAYGKDAKLCTELLGDGISEPHRVHSRRPGKGAKSAKRARGNQK